MPSECQLNDNFLARILPVFGEILTAKTLHSLECRVNADFWSKIYPNFWTKSVRLDRQPLTLEKGRGLALPLARRCFAKVLLLTLPYRQNNAVE